VTFIAGFYGATTKRDLTAFGPLLFIGLLAVILASIAALFLPVPLVTQAIGAVSAVLFTGYIIYDLNRAARIMEPTEGQVILLAVNVYLDIVNLFLSLLPDDD